MSMLVQVHSAISRAFDSCETYLSQLHKELTAYCQGSVGCNASMRKLYESMVVAWDWTWLCHNNTQSQHVKAFLEVWRLLAPCLRYTLWPNLQSHPHVTHHWPGEAELAAQYLILTKRVRDAVEERGADYHTWFPIKK